jgi:hypothetical protein
VASAQFSGSMKLATRSRALASFKCRLCVPIGDGQLGERCVVCGVWCVVCGVWCVVCGVPVLWVVGQVADGEAGLEADGDVPHALSAQQHEGLQHPLLQYAHYVPQQRSIPT